MATGFRAILLAGLAIGGVGGFVVPDLKLNDAVAIQNRGEKAPGAWFWLSTAWLGAWKRR